MRLRGGSYKLNHDLHRAGGMWPWAMLFVIAWSGVAFNLSEVYNPLMRAMFAHQRDDQGIPKLAKPQPEPGFPWIEARGIGRRLMQAKAQAKGFKVLKEQALHYDPYTGVFYYRVKSSLDIRDRNGNTEVYFDANTGAPRGAWLPTCAAGGDTIRTWITSLHMAALWGWPFKLFICVLGLTVAMLSVTGVQIWWRKRRTRRAPRRCHPVLPVDWPDYHQ